jgi:Holliday junction resolvase RusA-like endonuclease
MTRAELLKRYPNASASFIARNCSDLHSGVRADDKKPAKGRPLVRRISREEESRPRPQERARIRFFIYSTRPADWDNYSTKQLQDCLVEAGFLDADDWDRLCGQVVSYEVHSKEEETTVVEISDGTLPT